MVKPGNNDELGRCALTVFARAPVPGRAKTRLAEHIGDARACALYGAMLQDTLALASSVAEAVAQCDICIAYTPQDAFDNAPHSLLPFWTDEIRVAQRGTDLGARMLHCLADLRAQGYQRVVIIGSDAPDIPPTLIQAAFAVLGTAPVVLGPAGDGGYYLLGASVDLPLDAFEDIAWSTPSALEATRHALARHHIAAQLIGAWNDVDTREDLTALAARLSQKESFAPATEAWLRSEQLL